MAFYFACSRAAFRIENNNNNSEGTPKKNNAEL